MCDFSIRKGLKSASKCPGINTCWTSLLHKLICFDIKMCIRDRLERTHYYKPAAIIKDLAGKNRVVVAEKPGTPS